MVRNKATGPAVAGEKQAGFDVHTIFNTKTRHPLTREGQLI